MTGSGSPCGACKFLRRKCVKGCVFSPYFCYEQGATHFAAIHKVFGASNASKLLAKLPVSGRCWAAATISYEAQARLEDPIYGCVSYIFALQQQVVNLQARLDFLKELQFANSCANPQDVQNWFLSETNSNAIPELDPSFTGNFGHIPYCENGSLLVDDPNPIGSFENPTIPEGNVSFSSFQEATSQHYPVDSNSVHMQTSSSRWLFRDDADELGSVAFGKIQH